MTPDKPNTKIHFVHHLLRARDWQNRPQFGDLCRWWREVGAGVCALVGIGGAGKTAIAERFLRVLPQVLADSPEIPKNEELPTPDGLFVFSFYDAPNPDSFFAELAAWAQRKAVDQSKKQPSYQQTLVLLQQVGSCLLVLDGLEKVQDDGARGGVFGRILDGRLTDFVLRLAAGYLPRISTIITTRFPLIELDIERPPNYFPVDIGDISERTGIDLLRQRGVKGTDVELMRIVNESGCHALTVDLVGGYIVDLGGDTKIKLGTSAELKRAIKKERDPRRIRVRKQEYKFARIAERYREALAKKDPAALALLERVCLFRLGVDAETLHSIFTGKDKAKVSGLPLARLSKKKLQSKLDLLVDMRLLEANSQDADEAEPTIKYIVHPAVRDGFRKGLNPEIAKRGHEAASEGLETSLGDWPSGEYPSDPATLDLLEEIVYHTLEAGHVKEAWDIYWDRIGTYENLGWRLGAYGRGERICRAFADGKDPANAQLPVGLSKNRQGNFINEWGLYLSNLGRLGDAARCYERGNEPDYASENWAGASTGNQNLAGLFTLAGRLTPAKRTAEEALRLAKRVDHKSRLRNSYSKRANVRGLRGNTGSALNDFRDALHWQQKDESMTKAPLYGQRGVQHCQLLTRLGQNEEATRLTEANKKICIDWFGDENYDNINLLLADLARERGDMAGARELLGLAHEWAIARDAREPLCWSALVRGRIAFDEVKAKGDGDSQERDRFLEEAHESIEEGLRIARDCGYGIYHIDLLLLHAQVALHEGKAEDAERDILVALAEGVHPKKETGRPTLLAATDPECGYAWGIGDGQHLLAETYLLQAAQKLGNPEFALANSKSLPKEVKKLISDAREQLKKSAEIRKRIQDPKAATTEHVLEQLDGGALTSNRLKPFEKAKPDSPPNGGKDKVTFDVFLCHNSKDKPAIRQLAEQLKNRGQHVWLDEWELVPGRPWQEALEEIIEITKSVAVLIGKDGIGPWQDREMRACLTEFVNRDLSVIPVLLPGAPRKPKLPLFLKAFTWVDLRKGMTDDGITKIIWGITGKKQP